VAKRAGFILCLVVCALGVGASHARADDPPPPPSAVIATDVQIGSVEVSGLIHGDEPWSIGHSESHGCTRMQVPSAGLFNRVLVGTPVFIVPA
jgi:hypothetical protein